MNKSKTNNLTEQVYEYCEKYQIPIEYLFDILEDQKVTPMIRGKAMEYNAYLVLESSLPKNIWSVQKLNLNAQSGLYDEDISITHRRSGIILKVESKSAVRGSINSGKKSNKIPFPHFKVKCHRSRSNIKLANTSNDRYSVDSFDILITNPLNAIYQGNTLSENLEIIYDNDLSELLFQHYGVKNKRDLIKECSQDWRFTFPKNIAEEGYIPRTPYVKLKSDANWLPITKLEENLLGAVKIRKDNKSKRKQF